MGRLPCRNRPEPQSVGRERKETLERFTGLSLMACQGERRDGASIRKGSIRNNRDRPTAPFDRLIVLLQRKIGARFLPIVDTLI